MSFLGKSIKTMEIGLHNSIVYKGNFILGFISSVINLIIQLVFWPVYYNSGADLSYASIDLITISGYNLKEMITYSVIIYFIQRIFSMMNISGVIKEDIMNGGLNIYLLRPVRYLWIKWLQSVSGQVLNFSFSILLLLVAYFFLDLFFVYPKSIVKIFVVIFFVSLACILSFLINSIIGLLSFWLLETRSLGVFFNMTISVLSGSIFPIDLVKNQFGNILKYLPFSYMAFIPVQIFLGKINETEIVKNMVICFVWIIILFFLLIRLWKKGIRKYAAFGG